MPELMRKRLEMMLFLPTMTMVVLIGVILWRLVAQADAAAWVDHTDHVIEASERARGQLLAAQMEMRGYLLAPSTAVTNKFRQDWSDSQATLRAIVEMVRDNGAQEQRIVEILTLENRWMDSAERALAAANQTDRLAAYRTCDFLGKQAARLFEAEIGEEQRLRSIRYQRQELQDNLVMWGIPLLLIVAIGVFLFLVEGQVKRETGRFRVALTMAQEANVAKDNFLAAVSHDLRNPLNAILLWCNVLFPNDNLDAKTHRGIEAIHRAAKSQAQLIEDLLDVSRIESGRMRLDIQACDLGEVVRSAVETLRPAAEAKAINLHLVVDPKAGNVMGDPQRLQQVVWNLIANAVKFTGKSGKVQVRLERINSHAEIIVADTGQGMDAQTLDHLFEPFWQRLDHSRNPGSQGLGLGLSIVKNIVGVHGGSVTAHSEGIDKGSTFTVRLPVPPTTVGLMSAPRRHPTVAPLSASAHIARLDGISILIVDDDRDAREALKTLLTSLGANAREVDSVERAIAAIPEFQPDVLITDLGLPTRDGYSLAREVRSNEQAAGTGRLALVALTAYGRVEDRVEVFAAGFDSHLVKPVDPAELAATLRHLLQKRSAEAVA